MIARKIWSGLRTKGGQGRSMMSDKGANYFLDPTYDIMTGQIYGV